MAVPAYCSIRHSRLKTLPRSLPRYEDCLRILKLTNRSDPFTEIVAKAIFAIAQTGVRDPVQLRKLALEQIGTPPAG